MPVPFIDRDAQFAPLLPSPLDVNYACFARLAYHPDDPDASAHVAAHGWVPANVRPHPKCVVYRNKGNDLVVAFRGTHLSDHEDIASDLAIVHGTERSDPRFLRDLRFIQSLVRALRGCRILLVGHSLGGAVALFCLWQCTRQVHAAICYNGAAGPRMIAESSTAGSRSNFQKAYVSSVLTDPIGMTSAALHGARVRLKLMATLATLDPHSLANFLPPYQ